jgi:hypothetical protein
MRSMAKLRIFGISRSMQRKVFNADAKSHLCSYRRGETSGTKSLEETLQSDNADLAARKGSELDSRDREASRWRTTPI